MHVRKKTKKDLEAELDELRYQLYEATETIEAIRTGQIDALIVQDSKGHQLYTLKTADHAYRVFIEKMAEGAVTLNAEGIILYCNSQFATLAGLPLSEVIGLPFARFIAAEDAEAYNMGFRKCWSEDCKQEVRLLAREQLIPVQLSLTALELEEGISLSIIVTDLTAQKKTQLQLEQKALQLAEMNRDLEASNHDLQQFASVASHDLQEPLRKIQIFSSLLRDRPAAGLDADAAKYVEKITDSAARMKTLILDVLNYSKLSANDKGHERVDLNEVLAELLDDFEMRIHEKSAAIRIERLPVVEANRGQMRQMFQNIISNALKFVKDGAVPAIHITAKQLAEKSFAAGEQSDGAFCFISIKDNGIGFDERYAAHIFALFERLHGKDQYEGTGIGLAITKKIVEKHNGLINAKSSVGNGAEFMIILPQKQKRT